MIVIFLAPATVAVGYYVGLSILSAFARKTLPTQHPRNRFAIVIPAHNEEHTLHLVLQSIDALDYPKNLHSVFVIADNCTDSTAEIARSFNATVLERMDNLRRGKGYALEFAINRIYPNMHDAYLFLDADSELAPDVLKIYDARLNNGDRVIQGSIRTRNTDDSACGLYSAIGNVMDDWMASGRDTLRLAVPLRGSNMVMRREVLDKVPWNCYGLTEDAEYTKKLQECGMKVRFEISAKARSEAPIRLQDLQRQRRRWQAALTPEKWIDSKPLVLLHLLIGVMVIMWIDLHAYAITWSLALLITFCLVLLRALIRSTSCGVEKIISLSLLTCRMLPNMLLRSETAWLRTRRLGEN